ncbi:hypothetical protein PAAG_00245 [Paracoccidioides lutzii Pb01]|uniref:Uncharacterized protein n=1 Tax=Paracoccidioides lutzii (strain ATCC MYA-826 / Pb01) TaxID=502779 RepID=C1GP00_PARBA|nr:hypothetical protein PAAG_00245 [Paracoccidioides lutzii Pb01]EEH35922.2 hypothetical protein PAAG_00245 [Paracoccidioides lutzii Pb01]
MKMQENSIEIEERIELAISKKNFCNREVVEHRLSLFQVQVLSQLTNDSFNKTSAASHQQLEPLGGFIPPLVQPLVRPSGVSSNRVAVGGEKQASNRQKGEGKAETELREQTNTGLGWGSSSPVVPSELPVDKAAIRTGSRQLGSWPARPAVNVYSVDSGVVVCSCLLLSAVVLSTVSTLLLLLLT